MLWARSSSLPCRILRTLSWSFTWFLFMLLREPFWKFFFDKTTKFHLRWSVLPWKLLRTFRQEVLNVGRFPSASDIICFTKPLLSDSMDWWFNSIRSFLWASSSCSFLFCSAVAFLVFFGGTFFLACFSFCKRVSSRALLRLSFVSFS